MMELEHNFFFTIKKRSLLHETNKNCWFPIATVVSFRVPWPGPVLLRPSVVSHRTRQYGQVSQNPQQSSAKTAKRSKDVRLIGDAVMQCTVMGTSDGWPVCHEYEYEY